MESQPLRMLVLGAHPDDAEYHSGGLMARYRAAGHQVKIISVTNGDAGHHRLRGPELAAIRQREAHAAAAVIGAESEVWQHHDGLLEPILELRRQVIAEMRRYEPDLVLTHRTCDYHPDHRAVGHVVRDASYLLTVPAMAPEVSILAKMPVVAYMPDRFTRPAPLAGDVVLDVGPQLEAILDMLAAHGSQFFEWLPFNQGVLEQVPADQCDRRQWLYDLYTERLRPMAERYRRELNDTYGQGHGQQVQYAEVYEISEYATQLDDALRARLFGWMR
jgi:LmbE family N-acetylglucosaminyl deacetylase